MELTPQLFAIFAELVERACGLHYRAADRELFASKLVVIANDAGYSSLIDYYYRLRYDDPRGESLRALVQALVVHETYFFRELAPLVQLVDHHLAKRIAAGQRVRIWSAACSSGEEPSTLAMLLAERGLLDRCEIVASDISAAVIAKAQSGLHSKRALRDGHPPDLAARYLEVGPTQIRVAPRIHAAIDYRVLSLLDDAAIQALGTFDAVVCRNVLIYFSDATITGVIERLRSALNPGGWLAVGVSESLLRFGTAMRCEEHGGSFFYRSAA